MSILSACIQENAIYLLLKCELKPKIRLYISLPYDEMALRTNEFVKSVVSVTNYRWRGVSLMNEFIKSVTYK